MLYQPYVLYNATLNRTIPYPAFRLQTAKSARYALHHLTQRQKSCLVLRYAANNQILAVRVSKQSKHKFPRNYFRHNCAFINYNTNTLVVTNPRTGKVVANIPISEL